jgi:fatty aldehyde-generating acyl-ACP reductase
MTEHSFGFIFHPIDIKRDVQRKLPIAGRLFNEKQINFLCRFFPPVDISEIHGVVSQSTATETHGWFVACPYTPPVMLSLPVERVYNKLVDCGNRLAKHGAKIVGLGAYCSVVGDAGVTIAERLDVPVTTGDSYTVYIAVEAIREAGRVMEIPLAEAKVAVVGATGSIGSTCAEMLSINAAELILVGRRQNALAAVAERCQGRRAAVRSSTDMNSIYDADLILTVTSAVHTVIAPEHIKPGAVVCDVARPRDVSRRVYETRDDVLVIEGGMVEVPGANVDFGFDFGFPPGKSFACMAETMALSLEGRYEDYTIGKHIELERVLEIGEIATRHGFRLSGFRTFEHAVSDEHIARVKAKAAENRRFWQPSTNI